MPLLEKTSDKYGIELFENKKLGRNIFSLYLNTDSKREAKLILRVINSGCVCNLVKADNIIDRKEKEIAHLHENESIDKSVATDMINILVPIIQAVKERAKAEKKAKEQQRIIEQRKKIEAEEQNFMSFINDATMKITRYYGIGVLDEAFRFRALLKDFARGNYIEEITLVSFFLEKSLHKIFLKKKMFRVNETTVIENFAKEYAENFESPEKTIKLFQNFIYILKSLDVKKSKQETGELPTSIKTWTINLFKSFKKS
jgi:hypothetical protein